ncbi:Histone-lysine N-methyltransferase NSD3 [Halocaridina rubra]|uniref:Histone-lysine N-methyltransferase NSD3 n=1 Tax=Halocaridina rubra TaxID=373956 RepID=A0AAN9A506_HALRR
MASCRGNECSSDSIEECDFDKLPKNDSNGPKREKLGKKKKKKKRRETKISEDECYRCGGAGDLILCDVTDCPKSYHLQCLSLDKLPKGQWICPWHHCDECGLRSPRPNRCDYCPNSFCRQHVPGNLTNVPGVGNVCQEHSTNDIEMLRDQMEAKVAAEMTFSSRTCDDANEESAMDEEEESLSSHTSHDTVPLYLNDASIDASSSCLFDNSQKVSNSSLECEHIDLNASQNRSGIGPLKMRRSRCRPRKSDRVSEGHENNSSVINVNSSARPSQTSSKTNPTKATAEPPKNGIRSTRNTPVHVA